MSPLILARGLGKKFGSHVALDHVDFAVQPGRIVGLIGPNGAGKTTALRAILGLTPYDGTLEVLGREPFRERAALMSEASFIADVAVLPAWITVDHAIEFVSGVHPRFRAARARALLAKTDITGRRRMRELSKGMKTMVHLALTMAIDARLLVLDEPTLGLDILARRGFYDALINDYMDDTRTILITTHQVEEIENLLTDVLFIDRGRIVLDCSMEDIASRYAAIAVTESQLAAARAEQPFHERPMLGKRILYFERPNLQRLAAFGEVSTPSVADLFVAKLSPECARMNTYVWLVKREFWENRAIWVIPAAIGALLVLASLFGTVEATFFDSAERTRSMAGMMFLAFGALFFAAMSIYSYWYLLDCLYTDRRDRSVLFWKSLPISDAATVLSKLFVALIAIPLVYFAAADAASLLAAFVLSVRAHPLLGNALWQPDVWLQLQAVWLYVIVTTAIWYLPITGWLLVISAWAKRAVVLWSVLPPLAAILAERLFIGTHVCLSTIDDRLIGYVSRAFDGQGSRANWAGDWARDRAVGPPSAWHVLDPLGFLSSPATWIGAAVGAALIAAAIQLRARKADY